MFDQVQFTTFQALVLIPLSIVVAGLILEYWVIQPLRKSAESRNSAHPRVKSEESLRTLIVRLLTSGKPITMNRVSAGFVEKIGSFFSALPSAVVTAVATVFIVIFAVPLFIMLYYTEQFSICKFTPSCKSFLVGAFENHGPVRGILLSLDRVSRCGPFFTGGEDQVPAKDTHHLLEFVNARWPKLTWKNIILVVWIRFLAWPLIVVFFGFYFFVINLVLFQVFQATARPIFYPVSIILSIILWGFINWLGHIISRLFSYLSKGLGYLVYFVYWSILGYLMSMLVIRFL